jgi:hypothetical protein
MSIFTTSATGNLSLVNLALPAELAPKLLDIATK